MTTGVNASPSLYLAGNWQGAQGVDTVVHASPGHLQQRHRALNKQELKGAEHSNTTSLTTRPQSFESRHGRVF